MRFFSKQGLKIVRSDVSAGRESGHFHAKAHMSPDARRSVNTQRKYGGNVVEKSVTISFQV